MHSMSRISHFLVLLVAVAVLAREQRTNYDSRRQGSSSDASRFDLTAEERRCYQQQQFSDPETQLLLKVDQQLQSSEISNVRSRDPSTLTEAEKNALKQNIFQVIRSMTDERRAQMLQDKLEGFMRCLSSSNSRSGYSGR
ncbi:uncharacterized protein LOC144121031 isoform X1 [Amblyomma americanum]